MVNPMKFLIFLLILVAIVGALRLRRILSDRAQQTDLPRPPGTRDLDEETAVRPEIDAASLAAARAKVSNEIPDEVLQDVLLDATPQQAAKLFAGVSDEVMAGAIGQQSSGVHFQGQAAAEDIASLNSLSSAVDELDIWNFGEEPKKA
ncbi:hypothetical protein Dxin01_00558 [Deinococcus xinjiangensis]|uniref:Uncharacterized protein n=1 Tax=Deinococcus xinjiangensis TaxID=457454 RepID=A0ABP9V6C8_9DEIO